VGEVGGSNPLSPTIFGSTQLGTENPLKPPLKSAEDPYVSREKLLEIVVVYFLKLIRKKRSHG
jgi:hypothetical protein